MLHFLRHLITVVFLFLISIVAVGQENELEQKSIARTDGFYATINYDADALEVALELEPQPTLTLEHIKKVETVVSSYTNRPEIAIQLTKKGKKIFKKLTKKNVGKPIAIVLDKKIVFAPIVQSEIAGGRVVISGDFSMEEIAAMARRLKSE